MIEKDRPLCVQVPLGWDCLQKMEYPWVFDTPATENYDDARIGEMIEACRCDWFKDGENGKRIFVKCLEPAIYYVKINNACGGGSYCEFHKPNVRSL